MNDDELSASRDIPAGAMAFRATLDDGNLATRSGEMIPVAPDNFGETIFYIYERGYDKQNDAQVLKAEMRPYWLASGMQGQLDIMNPEMIPEWSPQYDRELNWFQPDTEHEFWSWTWPLAQKNYAEVDLDNQPDNEVLNFISSDFPLPESSTSTTDTPDSQNPGNTVQPTEAQAWRNGEALEQLVGTRTDRTYIFNQTGQYVPLTYKHLVSKIILGNFWLVDNTGATQKNLKARITFYGMPNRAIFFPLPEGDETGPGAPYVTIDVTDPYGLDKEPDVPTSEEDIKAHNGGKLATEDYKLGQYLSFYIMNKGEDLDNNGNIRPDVEPYTGHDMFYICPGVDFGQLEYKVEFMEFNSDTQQYEPHSRYGHRGAYFGDFKSVEFTREIEIPGEDGESETVTVATSDQVLYAGEVMVLNMTVYEKSGPGAGVWIRNWTNEKLKSATHHSHKGIYSDAEATAVRSAFSSSSTSESNKATQNAAYEIYGEDESVLGDNGEMRKQRVIRLYSDITFACYSSSTSETYRDIYYNFRLYPDTGDDMVILDGMGYMITFAEPSSYHHDEHKTFTIGNMRDIYFSNGTSTIYIDKEGYICRIDEKTGKYVRSTDEGDLAWHDSTSKNSTPIKFELDD